MRNNRLRPMQKGRSYLHSHVSKWEQKEKRKKRSRKGFRNLKGVESQKKITSFWKEISLPPNRNFQLFFNQIREILRLLPLTSLLSWKINETNRISLQFKPFTTISRQKSHSKINFRHAHQNFPKKLEENWNYEMEKKKEISRVFFPWVAWKSYQDELTRKRKAMTVRSRRRKDFPKVYLLSFEKLEWIFPMKLRWRFSAKLSQRNTNASSRPRERAVLGPFICKA